MLIGTGGALPVLRPAIRSGFADAAVRPRGAYWHDELGEFILPYDSVRQENSVDDRLLEFLESTYAAAADLAHWDRAALERRPGDVPLAR